MSLSSLSTRINITRPTHCIVDGQSSGISSPGPRFEDSYQFSLSLHRLQLVPDLKNNLRSPTQVSRRITPSHTHMLPDSELPYGYAKLNIYNISHIVPNAFQVVILFNNITTPSKLEEANHAADFFSQSFSFHYK